MASYTAGAKVSVAKLRELAAVHTISEIAEQTGQSYSTTWWRLNKLSIKTSGARHGDRKWTPAEDAEVITGMRNGVSATNIARKLPGRNRNMVLGRWFRLRRGK